MQFHAVDAIQRRIPARVALLGPTGSGKTLTALKIMRGLVGPEGRIVVFDTEHGTATRYARKVAFQHVELDIRLPDFGPLTYVAAIEWAAAEGYDGCVFDSLSHAWTQGALRKIDEIAKRNRGDSHSAWREVTPEHDAMVNALIYTPIHTIVTMRVKMEHVREQYTDGKGNQKTKVVKIGLQPVQRDGLEYEFDLIGDMDLDHVLQVTKSRFDDLDGKRLKRPDEAFGQALADAVDGATDDEIVAGLTPVLRALLADRYDDDAFAALVADRDEAWLRKAIAKAERQAAEPAPAPGPTPDPEPVAS